MRAVWALVDTFTGPAEACDSLPHASTGGGSQGRHCCVQAAVHADLVRLLQAEAWEAQAKDVGAQRKRGDVDHASALSAAQAEVQVSLLSAVERQPVAWEVTVSVH